MNKQFKVFAVLGTISTALFLFVTLVQWCFWQFIVPAFGTGKMCMLLGKGMLLSIFLAAYGLLLAGYASIGRLTMSRRSSIFGLIGCGVYILVLVMWVGQIFMSYEITYNSFYNFLIHFFEVIAFVLLGISVLLLPKEALPKPIGLLGSGGWFALVFVCLGEFLLYSPQFRLVDSIFSYQKILSVLFLLLRISSAVLTALTFVAILFIRKRDFSRSANVTGEGRAPFGQARGLPGECGGR